MLFVESEAGSGAPSRGAAPRGSSLSPRFMAWVAPWMALLLSDPGSPAISLVPFKGSQWAFWRRSWNVKVDQVSLPSL